MFLTGKYASPAWEFLGWKGQVIPAGTLFTSPGSPGASTCVTCGPAESVGGTPPFDVAFTDGTVAYRPCSPLDTPMFLTGRPLPSGRRGILTMGGLSSLPARALRLVTTRRIMSEW